MKVLAWLTVLFLPHLGWAQVEVTPLDLGISNVYHVQCGTVGVLVDACEPDRVEDILKQLVRKDLDTASIQYLILTHGHADHAGGAAGLKHRLGLQVIAGEAEKSLLARGRNPHLHATSNLGTWVDKHVVKVDSFPPVAADHWVVDSMELSSLGLPGVLLNLPGHTAGSLVWQIGDQAFVGDLIRGALLAGHRPRRHFFHEDAELAESHLSFLLDRGVMLFYPGHKGQLTAKRITSYLSQNSPQP